MDATEWINKLNLLPHPEGGYFGEVYRSAENVPGSALPSRFGAGRSFSTSIYYLLGQNDFSSLHRLKADEVWHHYDGGILRIICIFPDGNRKDFLLGKRGEAVPQLVIPAGCWFGARPEPGAEFVLAGCTVAPGFDFADFEMGERTKLLDKYPQHREIILQLTGEN